MASLPVYTMEDPVWRVKLDANERSAAFPYPVRRLVEKRWAETALHRYPDITSLRLRSVIAAAEKVDVKQVLVGGGSSELIAAACSAFGGAGRPIVYPWPSFSMYPVYAALADSPPVASPLKQDFVMDVSNLLQQAKSCGAKLIIISNPNNPTGGVTPPDELEFLIRGAECPVLIDEAYYEYYGETVLPLLTRCKNLLVTRTFSKAMGLAAARVGYLFASLDIAEYIGKRLLPYHVNALSLIAAEEVYAARETVMEEVRRTRNRRQALSKKMAKFNGIEVFPSDGNFLMVRTLQANALTACLAQQGIGVRNFSKNVDLKGCIRITVGTSAENKILLQAMDEFFTYGSDGGN
jgi:histidinol-phosphate aminotransferase